MNFGVNVGPISLGTVSIGQTTSMTVNANNQVGIAGPLIQTGTFIIPSGQIVAVTGTGSYFASGSSTTGAGTLTVATQCSKGANALVLVGSYTAANCAAVP